jgi:4'-phosphopantetheinyl transferase
MMAPARASAAGWRPPPATLTLEPRRVDVWHFSIDAAPECVARHLEHLSLDERERAARFHFERDRRRFIVGRGTVRLILGRYLDTEPAVLHLAATAHGKPFLIGNPSHARVHFNLTHSGAHALCAVADATPVGVDLEVLRDIDDMAGLMRTVFTPTERAAVESLRTSDRRLGFFTAWTRKEAVVKARGDGLAFDVQRFSVTLAPGEPAGVINFADAPREAAYWWLVDIPAGSDCAAALAVRHPEPSKDWGVRLWWCARATF